MIVRHGLVVAGIGVVLGLAAAAGLTRFLVSLLFEISPVDPLTYAAVSVVLLAAAATASYIPAHRASSINPVEALRADQRRKDPIHCGAFRGDPPLPIHAQRSR